VADYSPYVPGYMAARSVWDQGIVPFAKKAQAYIKGAAEIPPTVGKYISESVPRSGPMGIPTTSDVLQGIASMGLDARSMAGEMGEYAKENPIEMALSMAPYTGNAIAMMDAENLMAQALAAEEAGDDEKASNLRQLATFSFLTGSIPGIPSRAGIRAWQGSPHKFDVMSSKHIGTGEGAQAYGHGLYLAESKTVGEGYQKQLAEHKVEFDGKPVSTYADEKVLAKELGVSVDEAQGIRSLAISAFADPRKRGIEGAIADKRMLLESLRDADRTGARAVVIANLDQEIFEAQRAVSAGEKYVGKLSDAKGHLYNVDLKVAPDELLDWDAPLSSQSESVQKALAPYAKAYDNPEAALRDFLDTDYAKSFPDVQDVKWAKTILNDPNYDIAIDGADWLEHQLRIKQGSSFYNLLGSKTAGSMYERMSTSLGSAEAASARLRELGVPGIRYYDAGSRAAGEGTRNFVIFDDSLIDIRTRNGEALTPVERKIAVEEMTPQTADPAGPRTPQEVDEALESLERANINRARRIEETGQGYVPSKDAPLPEGRRGDPYDPELDVLERQRRLEQATTGSVKMLDEADVNQPIDKIPFIHNTEPNPALQNIKKQELYGTHIEPTGQYVSPVSESYLAELSTNNPAHLLTGVKTFENPLVIKFGGSYDASDNWKQVLHRQYGNKSGMDLNNAIRADGYDGIVTVDEKGNLSEIVDLTVGKGNVDLKAAGGIVTL